MHKYLILFFFIGFLCHAQRQRIIDDSTKQVYGPKTTKFFYEDDVFKNRKTLYELDTSFLNFHQHNLYNIQRSTYQELGNLGTASKSLYFQSPTQIETALGYNAYQYYQLPLADTKYYDTKSPFTDMGYIQGGRGQNLVSFTHARNIKPNFNISLDINRITSSQQYGAPRTREDKLADMWATRLYSNYTSKNEKYLLLANYTHFNQATTEQGGIVPREETLRIGEKYSYENYYGRINAANSIQRQNVYHVYQQYVLANGFQLYNISDYQQQYNYFADANQLGYYNGLYRIKFKKDTVTELKSHFRSFDNKVGVKGRFSGYNYRLHWRQRFYNLDANWQKNEGWKAETFFGGWTAYYFADSTRIDLEGEFSPNQLQSQLKADYAAKWFKAGLEFNSIAPTLLQKTFNSNILDWKLTDPKNAISTQAFIEVPLRFKNGTSLRPNAQITNLNNYIYFDTLALAKQTDKNINLLRIGLDGVWQKKKIELSWQAFYTAKIADANNLIRIPNLYLNAQFAYNFVYSKVLNLQSGLNLHYRSAYKADAYMPLSQQFYLQDKETIRGYPSIDVFTNMRINRVRLFLRYLHVNQWVPSFVNSTTPNYPAMRRTFQLGVNWPLFD